MTGKKNDIASDFLNPFLQYRFVIRLGTTRQFCLFIYTKDSQGERYRSM